MLHLAALTNILLQDRQHTHAFWGKQHELLDCFGFSGVAAGTNEHQWLVCCLVFFFLIKKPKPPMWIYRRQTLLQIAASWTKRAASKGAGATSRAGFSKSSRAARRRICCQSCPWGTCAEDEFGQHRTWAGEVHLLYRGKKSQRGQHLRFQKKHSFTNPLQQTARWESKPQGCWVGRCSPKPPGRFPRHGKAVPLFAAECDSLSWCPNRFHSNGFVILLRHS